MSMRAILLAVMLVASASRGATPATEPKTMADELLALERTVRDVPASSESLLSQVQSAAFRALGNNPKAPTTPDEAIAISIKISTALAKANFLQPSQRKDWVSTLGQAFTPHTLPPAELEEVLAFPGNAKRAPFLDRSKPIYFVDCDIGSLLIISVARRFGWDARLVEVPDHLFVRWHLPDGRTVNWDWTHWSSQDDRFYLPDTPVYQELRRRGIYLRSFEPAEGRAHYIGLIGYKAKTPSAGKPLLERALRDGAKDPTTYNNAAWIYVIQNDAAKANSDLAVMRALTAWSAVPDHGNTVDTVACAFAKRGDQTLALALEDYAAAHTESAADREAIQKNRERMAKGALCQ
jgi:hypothetical protein